MQTSPYPGTPSAVQVVLALAKKLHRAAVSESLASSMPVLRRILATNTLRGMSLPQLRRQQSMVQRKHILRMLAIEANHSSWEAYRQVLSDMPVEQLPHFDALRHEAGYPNLWFSTPEQALKHAQQEGGRVMVVGHQAVVLTEVVSSD